MAGKLSGTSPMHLTEVCIRCGGDARLGRRFDTTCNYYPAWIWLGLLPGLLPLIVTAMVGRKRLRLSFSLCRDCNRHRIRRHLTAWGLWLLLAATTLLAVWLENAWILIVSAALFLGAVAASHRANAPLQVSDWDDGWFTVEGFGERFLEARRTRDI